MIDELIKAASACRQQAAVMESVKAKCDEPFGDSVADFIVWTLKNQAKDLLVAARVLEAVAKVERMQLIIEPYCLGGWVRKVNDYHDMNTRARTWLETVELSKEMDWERKKYDN